MKDDMQETIKQFSPRQDEDYTLWMIDKQEQRDEAKAIREAELATNYQDLFRSN